MLRTLLQILLAAVSMTSAGFAQEPEDGEQSPIAVSLIAEHPGIVAGEATRVALQVHVDEGWHVYWKNSGESGFPTQVEWDLPAGFSLLRETWSAPSRFDDGQVIFGYDKEFIIVAEFLVPASVTDQKPQIGATVTWLACSDACVPGDQTEVLKLPLKDSSGPVNSKWTALMERHRAGLPKQNDAISASIQEGKIILNMEGLIGAHEAYFFSENDGIIDYHSPHELVAAGLGVPLKDSGIQQIEGVLAVKGQSETQPQYYQIKTDIHSAALPAAVGGVTPDKLLMTLLLAFAGGLILNLMPCVLPVVSLKVFQFMNMAGSSRRHAFHHGVIFTLGVVISFWVLAAVLLGLRAYGQSVGWGFQLQEPAFVVVLVLLLFLLGLSLLGVFEFGSSLVSLGGRTQTKSGMTSSFFSGVLATAVATPCTGPLLAPAVGFAVTLPPMMAMVVFTSLALGMASPYLLLSAFPSALRWLPKPGAWMVTFKQLMGFFMLATTLWLLWVFNAQVEGRMALVWLLGALLLVALAAWVFGRFGTPIRARPVRWIARTAAVALLLFGGYLGVQQAKPLSSPAESVQKSGWVAWNPDTLNKLRSEGKIVFVDFTAKWCLICQTNKVPMYSHEVDQLFSEFGVVKMEADWTRRDPSITQELEKFGRNGVPLYVLYHPNGEPIILPQLLTPEALTKAVHQATSIDSQ